MRSGHCPKCGGTKIGHLGWLPDTTGSEAEIRPQCLGTIMLGESRIKIGRLEAYVCAGCGLVEEYVVDVSEKALEQLDGFSWLSPSSGPYR